MKINKIVVEEYMNNTKFEKYKNTSVKKSQIKKIITTNTDVYTKNGILLLKFRKNILKKDDLSDYFNSTYKYTISNPGTNRGSVSGSKNLNLKQNKKINSSILGYYDKWGPIHKYYFKTLNMKKPVEVRNTAFSHKYPEKMKHVMPLLNSIDLLYKKLLPTYYKKQYNKAKETEFKLGKTAFTTITTNVNFKTTIHKDMGDDINGFGNLAVIERGTYKGGETCLPRYGIGVDVREGDLLFMNVHEWHGNLPIYDKSKDAVRMSIVCYLRENVWKRTRNKGKKFKDAHFKIIANMYKKMKIWRSNNKTKKKTKRAIKKTKKKRYL